MEYKIILFGVLWCLASLAQGFDDEDDFTCPEPSGPFADPANCKKFYQCVDGHPYAQRCPSSLHFDDIAKFCTLKQKQDVDQLHQLQPQVLSHQLI